MQKYNGRILYRLRPDKNSYISGEAEKPYEIHFISFDSGKDLQNFMNDKSRKEYMHLKDASVKSILMVKRKKM